MNIQMCRQSGTVSEEKLEDTHLGREGSIWGLCCEMGVKIPTLNEDVEGFELESPTLKANTIS